VHRVVADLGQAEHAFNLGPRNMAVPPQIRVVPGGVNEVQKLFAHQIFQRVAKSEALLYALRGFALCNPSPMKFYS
jgi:hypothetical protein